MSDQNINLGSLVETKSGARLFVMARADDRLACSPEPKFHPATGMASHPKWVWYTQTELRVVSLESELNQFIRGGDMPELEDAMEKLGQIIDKSIEPHAGESNRRLVMNNHNLAMEIADTLDSIPDQYQIGADGGYYHCVGSIGREAIERILDKFRHENSDSDLPARIIEVCKKRRWSLHWEARVAHIVLELSEFTEAIRGKGAKDRLIEAGDLVFTVMAYIESHGIPWTAAIESAGVKCIELEGKPPYHGEEVLDVTPTVSVEDLERDLQAFKTALAKVEERMDRIRAIVA